MFGLRVEPKPRNLNTPLGLEETLSLMPLLGGLGVSTYAHNDFVGVTAHNSDGRSYGKYFQIPLDSIDDFCQALIEARDFTRANQPNNTNT